MNLYIRNLSITDEEMTGLPSALAQYAAIRKQGGRESKSLQQLLQAFFNERYTTVRSRPTPTVENTWKEGDIVYDVQDGSFRKAERDPPAINLQEFEEQQQETAIRTALELRRRH